MHETDEQRQAVQHNPEAVVERYEELRNILSWSLTGIGQLKVRTFGGRFEDVRVQPTPSSILFIPVAVLGYTNEVKCIPAYKTIQDSS